MCPEVFKMRGCIGGDCGGSYGGGGVSGGGGKEGGCIHT
jgi:hypothetical protein